MSQQYDNTNRGVLFRNDRRESDKHPEYNGSINIDGVEYWLSAWVKDGKKGKFFSLAVKPKQQRSAAGEYEAERRTDARQAEQYPAGIGGPARVAGSKHTPVDLDDEIPFSPEWR